MSKKNSEKEPEQPVEQETEQSEQESESLRQKVKETEDLLKRVKADFDNYRKNAEKDKSALSMYACQSAIEKMLPVLDSFEQAMLTTKSDSERKGIGLIYAQMLDILAKEGLKPIDAVNRPFDPELHEILMKQESGLDDDIILEEFQKGYMLHDHVIRHSKVKVSKKKNGISVDNDKQGNTP